MGQGESSREKARLAILALLADQENLASCDIVRDMKGPFAKNTICKYREELRKEGLISARPGGSEENFRPRYSITERGKDLLEREGTKRELCGYLDEMSAPEIKVWLQRFKQRGARLRFSEAVVQDKDGKEKGRFPGVGADLKAQKRQISNSSRMHENAKIGERSGPQGRLARETSPFQTQKGA